MAIHAQCLAKRLEAVQLVVEGFQIILATGLQVVAKTLLLGQLGTQHQGVDEKAHQPFDIRTLAIGQRRTDNDIALTTVACQQQREQRMQADKGRSVVTLTELLETRPQRVVDGREDQLAATGLVRRAWFVQRQAVHIGDAAQALDPERLELLVVVTEQR
ncbi:hypothetical protein D3C84_430980 [compost metagenome]